jgi:hypothetical protein
MYQSSAIGLAEADAPAKAVLGRRLNADHIDKLNFTQTNN